MINKHSIFSKLFLSYLLIIVVSFFLFIGIFFYLFHTQLYKGYEDTFQYQYDKITKQLSANEGTAQGLHALFAQHDYSIYIIDEERRQLLGPDPKKDSAVIGISEALMAQLIEEKFVSEGSFQNGELRYLVASSLHAAVQGEEPAYMVMIFHDMSHEYQQVIWMIILTFTISMLFAAGVLWFISKKITQPLREMSQTAIHYAKGDFSKKVAYRSDDEIGQLAKSFTYMAQELHGLEKRRREFISNVSHDLRSPLTSMKGFLVALLDGTIPDERRPRYYKLMKEETERMIKLVNDTLVLTQLEEGQQQLQCRSYSFTKQVKMIIDKLEPQLQKKRLYVRFSHERSPVYVFADKERIEQVMINLLQNAIQFSEPHAPIDICLETKGGQVKVSIQDYGEGIPEEKLQAIWQRFYKVDEARAHKSGFGLGLSIVKSILELHGSDIEVESKPGEGTTFSFALPITDE